MSKLRVIQDRVKDTPDFESDLRGLPIEDFLISSRLDVVLATDRADFQISVEAMNDFGVEQTEIFDDQGRKLTVFRRVSAASGSHKVDALYLQGLATIVLRHFPAVSLKMVTLQNVRASMRTNAQRGLMEDAMITSLSEVVFEQGLTVSEEIQAWGLNRVEELSLIEVVPHNKSNIIPLKKTGS